jgi:hypothetical protein
MSFHSRVTLYFRFKVRHFELHYLPWPTSGIVGSITNDLGRSKVTGWPLEFRRYVIPLLTYSVLPVWCPPFWISLVGRRWAMSAVSPLIGAWSKLWLRPLEFRWYVIPCQSYTVLPFYSPPPFHCYWNVIGPNSEVSSGSGVSVHLAHAPHVGEFFVHNILLLYDRSGTCLYDWSVRKPEVLYRIYISP